MGWDRSRRRKLGGRRVRRSSADASTATHSPGYRSHPQDRLYWPIRKALKESQNKSAIVSTRRVPPNGQFLGRLEYSATWPAWPIVRAPASADSLDEADANEEL